MTRSRKAPYIGKGYINTKKSVFKAVFDVVWLLTANILPAALKPDRKLYHWFISHIYISMLALNRKQLKDPAKDNSAPIYCRLIDDHFGRGFNWRILKDANIIEVKPHNSSKHKSREYKITDDIFKEILKITEKGIFDFFDGKDAYFVNLFTGRRVSVVKSQLYLEYNGDKKYNIPPIIKKSIRSLKPCPIDIETAVIEFKKLKRRYDYETEIFDYNTRGLNKKSAGYKIHLKDYRSHRGKYSNELSCLETIIAQAVKSNETTKKGRSIYYVHTPYKIQKSGRLTEIHGGFQSLPTVLKYYLLKYILDAYNYDLKTSQGFILLDEMLKYGIKCPWLRKYLSDPEAKYNYADKVFMPVSTWKNCFYAVIMGANAERKDGDIYKTIENHHKTKYKTNRSYRLFLKEAAPLIRTAYRWRDLLYCDPIKEHKSLRKGTLRWKNACNMIFRDYEIINGELTNYSPPKIGKPGESDCKRRLSAFILQGREALFIHHMTVLCTEEGIPVYKNEHDGLITGRKIPQPLITQVKDAMKLNLTDLVPKRLASKRKIKERIKYCKNR